jgi:hypothetical protein
MEPVSVLKLVKTRDGVEIVCPRCTALILKARDERAAILNSFKIAKHECVNEPVV